MTDTTTPQATGPDGRRSTFDQRMAALQIAAARATRTSAFCDVPHCVLLLHPDRLELRSDRLGHPSATGASDRRTVQGVGAVVLTARVALAAQGWAVEVDRLPRPDDRELIAVLRPVAGAPEAGLAPLAVVAAGGPRRRRAAPDRPLSPTLLERLARAAALESAVLVPVESQEGRRLIEELEREARAVRAPGGTGPTVGSRAGAGEPAGYLMLSTRNDDELAWLRSGEAMERVLLRLAREDRTASVLPDAVDAPPIRARLRSALCWDDHPQALIRVE